jgi:hypothetical protein
VSRGPGRVEKALRELLIEARKPMTAEMAAELVYDRALGDTSAAERASVRRALGRLKRIGAIANLRNGGRLWWHRRFRAVQSTSRARAGVDPIVQMSIDLEISRRVVDQISRQIEAARQERRASFKVVGGTDKRPERGS